MQAENVSCILLPVSHNFHLTGNAKWSFGRRLWSQQCKNKRSARFRSWSLINCMEPCREQKPNTNPHQLILLLIYLFVWGGCQCDNELTESSQHTKIPPLQSLFVGWGVWGGESRVISAFILWVLDQERLRIPVKQRTEFRALLRHSGQKCFMHSYD